MTESTNASTLADEKLHRAIGSAAGAAIRVLTEALPSGWHARWVRVVDDKDRVELEAEIWKVEVIRKGAI